MLLAGKGTEVFIYIATTVEEYTAWDAGIIVKLVNETGRKVVLKACEAY